MKKKALILAGALAFDLGVVVAAGHAEPILSNAKQIGTAKAPMLKEAGDGLAFLKFNEAFKAEACMTNGGKTTTQDGAPGCSLPKATAEKISLNFSKVR